MNGENGEISGLASGKRSLNRLYRSLLVIAWSIVPPRKEEIGTAPLAEKLSRTPHLLETKQEIRYYLTDLDRGVDRQGEMKLCFPGCLAFVAPFLLFRLKRSGFSNCRALFVGEGVTLSASR